MIKTRFNWQRFASFLCVIFLATACFRFSGDVAQGNEVAQSRPSDTPPPTEVITETVVPSATSAADETAEATEDQFDSLLLPGSDTPTPPETLTNTPTDTPTSTNTPTSTATPEPVDALAAARATATPDAASGGTAVAQAEGDDDTFVLSATAFVREVTETALAPLTLTAAAGGVGFPTNTPTDPPTNTPEPLNNTTTGSTGVSTPVLSGTDCIYQMAQGENLFRISLNYGVSLAELQAANPQITNIQFVLIGEQVVIPGCGRTGLTPPVRTPLPSSGAGTSSGGVTAQGAGVGTTIGTGGQTGTGTGATTGSGIVGGSTCPPTYTVQQYDTLFEISLRCNVPMASIAAANGITNLNLIIIQDVLTIPQQ